MAFIAAMKFLLDKAISFVKPKVVTETKVLRAERKAYRDGAAPISPGMRQSFLESYVRLVAVVDSDARTSPAPFAALEARMVVPDYLRGESIQKWLRLDDTREGLCSLAENRLRVTSEPTEPIRASLSLSFERETGDSAGLSDGAINSIVDALVQSYTARLEDQSAYIIDAVQGEIEVGTRAIRTDLNKVHAAIEAVAESVDTRPVASSSERLATQEATRLLDAILKTRSFDTQIVSKISRLAELVTTGELREASAKQKQQVYLWTARLLAAHKSPVEDVERYFNHVDADPNDPAILSTQALILENAGKSDEALRLVREVETGEAQSAFVGIIFRKKGAAAAIAWYEEKKAGFQSADFTPMGWTIVSGAYAELGLWEKSASCLEIARPLFSDFPDLYFIEGMYRAVMLFPTEFRQKVFNQNLVYGVAPLLEGTEAENWRRTAIESFAEAETQMAPYSSTRVRHAREARLWLSLGSPDEHARSNALTEIGQSLRNPSTAASLYHIVRQYPDIDVDKLQLSNYFSSRLNLGGLSDDEWVSWFLLASDDLTPPELLIFLDEHDSQFRRTVDHRVLATARIQALMSDGDQATRARAVLEANRTAFSGDEAALIDARILAAEGADVRPQLEELYAQNPSLMNAITLSDYLLRVKDFIAMEPVARHVYQLDRSVSHALALVFALQSLSGRVADVVKFLSAERDITDQSEELLSYLAWGLSEMGDWSGARAINNQLLIEHPHAERHVGLDFNIAVKCGDWDHFSVILEREWPVRETYSAGTLLLLAQLAGDSQASRLKAFELLKLAVERGNGSARVLVAAYDAAVNLGMENELTGSWLSEAASADGEGIVQRVTLRHIVEDVIPAAQKRNTTVLEAFNKSTVPIQLLASALNLPLGRLYAAIPLLNEKQSDPRKRPVLPFFGVRLDHPSLEMSGAIGFDITALISLSRQNLLEETLSQFDSIFVAAETMPLLMKEVRRIRFHQPSEVVLAEALLDAFENKVLIQTKADVPPPAWLVEQVGDELALQLQKAKLEGGRVVASYPVMKAGSLAEEGADLGEYASYIMTLRDFVQSLTAAGRLPLEVSKKADEKLSQFDLGYKSTEPASINTGPILVDVIAPRLLQQAGVLEPLQQVGVTMHCPPSLKSALEQTVKEAKERDKTVALLDKTRIVLRREIEAKRVLLLPDYKLPDRLAAQEMTTPDALAALAFMQSDAEVSRFIVDDRYFTRLNEVVGDSGKKFQIFSTLDVINGLMAADVIPFSTGQFEKHRLRAMGIAYMPVSTEELCAQLDEGLTRANGETIESQELRILRQSIATSCSLDLSDIKDRQYLEVLDSVLSGVVTRFWTEERYTIETATLATRWMLDNVARPLWTAASTVDGEPSHEIGIKFVAFTVGSFLWKAVAWPEEKRKALSVVFDDELLVPARRGNAELLAGIASYIESLLMATLGAERTTADTDGVVALIISTLPLWLHERFTQHHTLGPLATRSLEASVQFSKQGGISFETLYTNALVAARDGLFESSNSPKYRFVTRDDQLLLQLETDGGWFCTGLHEFGALLPSASARRKAVAKAARSFGPTFGDSEALLSVADDRPLSEREFSSLLYERVNGVASQWARIRDGSKSALKLKDAAPDELVYYDRLLGSAERQSTAQVYLNDVVRPYRATLICRDLTEGLRIALLGYFHPSVAPSTFLHHIDDETLWVALTPLRNARDPFTLAGMAELGLSRTHDERFYKLADECIVRLSNVEETMQQIYEPAALFARIALSEIQVLESAASIQPYWKRMAAWMQGGIVLQQFQDIWVDTANLGKWTTANLRAEADATEILDIYRDPSTHRAVLNGEAVRCTVIRLLAGIVYSAESTGILITAADQLRSVAAGLREFPGVPTFLVSGPCWMSPDEELQELSDADSNFAEGRLREDPLSKAWTALAIASNVAKIPRRAYQPGIEGLRKQQLESNDPAWLTKVAMLQHVASLAVSCADQELAEVVRDMLTGIANQANEPEKVVTLVNCLLLAAGALRSEENRNSWLNEATRAVAFNIPTGVPAEVAAAMFRIFFEAQRWRSGPSSWAEIHARSAG